MQLRACLKSLSLRELLTHHEDVTSEITQRLELELEQRLGQLEPADNVSDPRRSRRPSTSIASLFRRRLALRRSFRPFTRAVFAAVAPALGRGADFSTASEFALLI